MAELPRRFQSLVIPILRDHLGPTVKVSSWVEEVDRRQFPMVNVRRIGGARDQKYTLLDVANIELTAYSKDGLVECENLYQDALLALYNAVRDQTVVPGKGHINSVLELMGMTQFGSLYSDSWRVQGVIELRIRPSQD